MDDRTQFFSPLESTLAKIKKEEDGLWGKMQSWNHQWLTRLEGNPFFQNYCNLLKKPRGDTILRSEPTIDLDSLFLLSLLFHLLLLFLLTRLTFSSLPLDKPEPILVRILDLGEPAQEGKERAKKEPEKIARTQPRPSASSATAEEKSTSPASRPAPLLPGPKVIAEAPKEKDIGLTGEPVESLIQLPTRHSGGGQVSIGAKIDPLPSKLAGGGVDAKRPGKGGSAGLSALPSPDFGAYLKEIEKRVKSFWQYPEGVSGSHQVYLRFALDRAGKLVRVEVLDSTDSELDSSALQAMKRASPFPPIPDNLKQLAGEDLGIRFTIDLGVKSRQ